MASRGSGPNPLALKTVVIPYASSGHVNVTIHLRRNGEKLPLMMHGAKIYAVACPGEEFEVRLERSNRLNSTDFITMSLDGQSVSYSKLMFPGDVNATFDYMSGAPGCRPDECTRFKFVKRQADNLGGGAIQVSNPDDIKAGRIRIATHDCYPDPMNPPGQPTSTRQQQQRMALPEGKKFFMAPSLGSESGEKCGTLKFHHTRYISSAMLGEVTIHYETAATLVLRNVLDAAIPEHKAITQQYGMQPAAPAHGGMPAQRINNNANANRNRNKEARPAPSAAASAVNGVGNAARAAGVKRERDMPEDEVQARPRPQQHSQPIIVDLTEPEPLKVNGEVVGKDQMAVCDLTAEQQGRPGSWQVVAKVKEEVQIDA